MKAYDKSTAEQKAVAEEYQRETEAMVRKLLEIGVRARAARVDLPHTNEEGEKVVHGCNTVMYRIREMCEGAITMLNHQGSHDQLYREPDSELFELWRKLRDR